MISTLTTLSCKHTVPTSPPGVPMLKQSSARLVTSNTHVGTMTTGNKSPATVVNTLLVAATASSISTETLRPLTSILNGNDKFPNSRRSKIVCGNGSLRSYRRLSTSLVFKSLVSCCCYSGIAETMANAILFLVLDIDGFRIDKGQQVTVDAAGHWSNFIRGCASSFGKENFFIPVCEFLWPQPNGR